MCILLIRMIWLFTLLTFGLLTAPTLPELIEQGPDSGIVLKEQSGLLITNCRLHTQRVFVRLNPREVCRKNVPVTAQLTSWAGTSWSREVLSHAEADITHMLQQLDKFTITQAELGGHSKRPKRFIGGLLTAAAAVGTLFSIGLSSVNTVSLTTVKRHVSELQAEIPSIRAQINQQQHQLQTIGQTAQGTVLVVNTHSETLNKTLRAVNSLLSVVQVDYAHTQLVNSLMSDMLRDIGSSVDSLAMGRIPPYLVPLSLVQSLLTTATRDLVTPLQAHLAYTLGNAVPIYVNPEDRELAFIINLPLVVADNIYRLKDVINVGFWQGDVHVKVQTPSVIAYHDSSPELHLAPNLRMCTLTKDIHYLCPSKPFIRDDTNGICGLKPMTPDSRCPTTATHRSQVTTTQAEIVGSRWLVNTPVRTATLTYDQHETSTRITLPDQTLWITVPENAILHIGDFALYHLNPNQYESEVEISEFFSQHTLELDPSTLTQLQYEGTQTVDVTPIDNVLKEIASTNQSPSPPITYAWSTPDTILVFTMALGYLLTFGIAFLFFKRTQTLQRKLNKCSEGLRVLTRSRKSRRDRVATEPQEVEDRDYSGTDPPAIFELTSSF